ncbi:terminase [Micromonospora arida]
MPLDPWEQLAAIHMGELMPDGITPRGHTILAIVARQNGKTTLLRVLTAYWLLVETWPIIWGMSNLTKNAKKSWQAVIDLLERNPFFRGNIDKILRTPGQEYMRVKVDGYISEYSFGAANADAARSESVDRLIVDELRQHKNWAAMGAAEGSQSARPLAQTVCITNQGDETSQPLVEMRNAALEFIKTGEGDDGLILLEWSAEDNASPLDLRALAQANPNLNRVGEDGVLRMAQRTLLGKARRAIKAGGQELDEFRTNYMCQFIRAFNGAINPEKWAAGYVAGDLRNLKSRLAFFLDVSPGPSGHIALVGAAVLEDSRVRVETIREWDGGTASADMRRDLPGVLRRSGARKLGWMPNSETAKFGPDLRKMRIGGVVVEEITSEVSEVCMSFAEQVDSGQIIYGDDQDMLTDHVTGAFKKYSGDKWKFSRQGKGDCDAAYAAAGAVYLARTMPPSLGPKRGFFTVDS